MTRRLCCLARRRAHPLLVLVAAGLVAGCSVPWDDAPYPAQPQFPIEVVQEPVSLRLPLAWHDRRLAPADRRQLAQVLDAYRERGRGPLVLTVPADSPRIRRLVEHLQALAVRRGVDPTQVTIVHSQGHTPEIELAYLDMRLVPPDCVAETIRAANPSNAGSPGFGCATQRNLAHIIANPADYVSPREQAPPDAARMNRVLDQLRQGLATGTQPEAIGEGAVAVSGVTEQGD